MLLYCPQTNVYRLSLYETASSLKFVLNTDSECSQQEVCTVLHCNVLCDVLPKVRDLLWAVYTQCYVEFVSKSPMSVAGEMVS